MVTKLMSGKFLKNYFDLFVSYLYLSEQMLESFDNSIYVEMCLKIKKGVKWTDREESSAT